MKKCKKLFVALAMAGVLASTAQAQIRIAFTDALSGPSAVTGVIAANTTDMVVEKINAAGGVLDQKVEVKRFDNKNTAQESIVQLQAMIAEGFRYVLASSSSGAGMALSEAIDRHNQRNPDKAILFLNTSAIARELTNEKCSFWHFRFDMNSDQKVQGLVSAIAADKNIKKVYLLGGDYVLGQQVSRSEREMLQKSRPDIQIVGDELHPFQKITDFSPYIAKIKASGADAVISSNFGNDLALPIKAAREGNLDVHWYTFYATAFGVPTALSGAGVDRVHAAVDWHANVSPNPMEPMANEFKRRYNMDFFFTRIFTTLQMLAKAMEKTQSTDPLKVALALEDMRYAGPTGEVWMRRDDHQLMAPQFLGTYSKVDGKEVKYDIENTGYGFRTTRAISMKEMELPTTCKMKRPAGV